VPRKKPIPEIDTHEWLRKLPKCELHLHLEGTIEPKTLVELSKRHDADPLTLASAKKLYTYENFIGFLMAFKAVTERLRTPEDYELITYNMVRALAGAGRRPCRGLHLLRHHLLLEAGRGGAVHGGSRTRAHARRKRLRHHRLLAD
jgi:hypothetical protein